MNNKNTCIKLRVILFFTLCFNSYGENIYSKNLHTHVYANIDAPDIVFGLSKSRDYVVYTDIRIPAKKCSYGDTNLCIESDYYLFTLPKKVGKTTINKDWECERYPVKQYEILGKSMKLIKTVFSKSTGEEFTYWFSHKWGILWIKLKIDGKTSFLTLRGKCGYGSSKECK